MRNRWKARARHGRTPLEALVARSRLIGQEDGLGLFGGGNTSTKCREADLLGQPQEVLWVKGSGSDLKDCAARHFAPLPLGPLRRLSRRRRMTDEEMVEFLSRCLLDPRAPRPSIETLLHAFIPEADIDHTHADAILSLTNTPHGARLVRRVLGPRLIWIPYIQPGFALARRVLAAYRLSPGAEGAVLEQHGLLTWGPDGRTSYDRTIRYVSRAERFVTRQRRRLRWSAVACETMPAARRLTLLREWLPAIRRTVSRGRKPCIAYFDSRSVLEFVNAARMPEVAGLGPATPDHMLRTRRLPLIVQPGRRGAGHPGVGELVRQLERYAAQHARYFRRYRQRGQTMRDPSPRILLIPAVGMLTTGQDATECEMVARIYTHAMRIMRNAACLGGYTSVSEREAFHVEYWPLELYKLSLAPPEPECAREVVLVTGATGGIGRAIAEHLVDLGASVVVTDLHRHAVEALAAQLDARAGRRRALGLVMDVTSESSIERAFDRILTTFGGVDGLVSNAGVAGVSSIDRLPLADWERSLSVNATGHFLVARAMVRRLRAQGMGGALVFVASKNVLAPGKEFGAYSAAKAAETQLARVLAIENGEAGIRVNVVNPDGVFEGSGLWDTIRTSRARTYGIAPGRLEAYYRSRNLLRARVLPSDVAEAVGFLVSRRSAKTTGCILTVDGGVREAFPR